MLTPWIGLAILLVSAAASADYPLEIVQLNARLPEDVTPILAPLAGPDGTVVGSGNALFIRASPARLADIRRALAEIDRPARALMMQVRQMGRSRASGGAIGARVDERIGDAGTRGRIRIGAPAPGGTGVRAWAGQQDRERDLLQEVRAMDGHPARIAIGTEQPLSSRERAIGSGYRIEREGTSYHRSESGFTVLPRVIGDRVVLEISAQSADPGIAGTIQVGEVSSRVEGRLGEWLPIGAGAETTSRQGAGLLSGGRSGRTQQNEIEIRVLPLDDQSQRNH